MDVLAPFIADGETAEAIEPRPCALNPPPVASQSLADVHTAAGNPGHNGAPTAFGRAATMVISLVSVQFVRSAPRTSTPMPHGRHGIEGGGKHEAVMPIGSAQAQAERCACPVDHNMALRARFAAIRRVRAVAAPPF